MMLNHNSQHAFQLLLRYCVAVISLAFACVHLAQADPPDDRDASLRVLTYNVRYASDQSPHAWAVRRPVAKSMLQSVHPDLIGMQEALFRQVKDFAHDFPNYRWIGMGRDGGSRGEMMAVFYNPARLEPLEFDHFWLSESPDIVASISWESACRRMVTWVRFLDRKTKREFYFLNTHFDHVSQRAREESAKLIVDRTGQLDSSLPIILAGDFNAAAGESQVYQELLRGGFSDSWTDAEQRIGDEISTFHGYQPAEGKRRIDWIMTQGGIRTLSSQIIRFEQDGQFPSDHFPVLAVVQFDADAANHRAISPPAKDAL